MARLAGTIGPAGVVAALVGTNPPAGGTGLIHCMLPMLIAGANTTLTLVVHTTNAALGPIVVLLGLNLVHS